MNCTTCGTPLVDNSRFCSKCGASTTNDAPSTSYFSEGDMPPYVEHLSFIDKEHPTNAEAEQTQRPLPGNEPGPVNDGKTVVVAPSSSPAAWQAMNYPAAQQPGYPSAGQTPPYRPQYPAQANPGPQPYWQVQSFPASPQPATPQVRWMLYLVIGLAVLVILIGGLGTIAFLSLQHNANQATGIASSTPAIAPSTTPGAITTTDPQALFTQVTGRTPIINDTLATQGMITWQNFTGATGNTCTFTGGALHVIGPKGTAAGCIDTQANLNNFALQVQMTIIQGDGAGLVFQTGIVNTKVNIYNFTVDANGDYNFVTFSANVQDGSTSTPQLLSSGHSSMINTAPNQPNVLTLIARNQNTYLYINKQYVTTVTETTTNANAIGLVGTGKMTQASVDIAYNNFQIWNI